MYFVELSVYFGYLIHLTVADPIVQIVQIITRILTRFASDSGAAVRWQLMNFSNSEEMSTTLTQLHRLFGPFLIRA